MSPNPNAASTGDDTFDEILGGGYPRNRSVLVTGGPGTGKSTHAMQFLQEGLDVGESCLYISTEQTIEELRDAFAGFDFDLDHDDLSFASVHATPGQTIEEDDTLTLQTLGEDDDLFDDGFGAPFTGEYIRSHLDPFGPRDRVVFDSASGLSVISENEEVYRRTVLDLVRFFDDHFGATTLFTAEAAYNGGREPLEFSTHGVVRLERRVVNDDPHRFLTVTKMRGVDHDRRTFEVEFVGDGIRVGPDRRSQPPALKDHVHRAIGLPGLDALCGGGLVRGTGVLLEHDGRANLTALFSTLLTHAIETGHTVVLVPTISLREHSVEGLFEGHGLDLDDLFADDRLYVVDLIGAWDRSRDNVYGAKESAGSTTTLLEDIREQADGPLFSLINGGAVTHTLGEDAARRVRYFQEANLLAPEDFLMHVVNPAVVSDRIAAFYTDAADQVLETWIGDDGLQYVTLRKSPCGFVGSTSLVEYVEEPPYLRVQHPPQTRNNPYKCE